jgi:protein disulfide-isomerase
MKRIVISGVAALGLALLATATRADEASWLSDYKAALEAAKKDGKVVLADFTGSDWCPPCQKLKKEVFESAEFKDWAGKNAILLEVDFPRKKQLEAELKKQNGELAKKFKVDSYPTVIVLNGEGEELGRTKGYGGKGYADWIKKIEPFVAKNAGAKKPEKKEDAKADGASWGDHYDKAIERAKKEKKLILADFTGSDWCGWCIKLKKEVFDTPEFKQWAGKNVVLLELDYPRAKAQSDEIKAQNAKLQEKFSIEGYPTILFIDGEGNKVGQMGYMPGGPAAWTAEAQKIVDQKK